LEDLAGETFAAGVAARVSPSAFFGPETKNDEDMQMLRWASTDALHWAAFLVIVFAILAVDLGVLNRKAHVVSLREAALFTAGIVALAALFAVGIFTGVLEPVFGVSGARKGLEFVTGYLIEFALSVDNIFVFVLLFSYFRVPPQYQHRVLFWGILGALVMRGTMIGLGAYLVERFHWILYIFGAFLVFTGIKMAREEERDIEVDSNPVLRLLQRYMPITPRYHGQKFFVQEVRGDRARRVATPLFVVLVLVETTDLMFAIDSIPAIFAVTRDPFIVFTSNVFAILGLRSMYFLLANIVHRFHYLRLGLSVVLVFIGVKMLVGMVGWHVPIGLSLGVVGVVLATAVIASLLFPKKAEAHPVVTHSPLVEEPEPVAPVPLPSSPEAQER